MRRRDVLVLGLATASLIFIPGLPEACRAVAWFGWAVLRDNVTVEVGSAPVVAAMALVAVAALLGAR